MITLEVDYASFERQLGSYSTAVSKSIVRSLNRTLDSAATFVDKAVRQKVRLKSKDVKKSLSKNKAFRVNDSATLTISDNPIPLYKYIRSTGGKKRTGVKVNVTGTPKLVKGAFVSTMKSGHTGIYKRVGKKRLPIEELFSTSVRDVFKSEDAVEDVLAFAKERYAIEFQSNLAFYSGR